VLRHGDAQIALLDTPGLHRPRSRLGRRMNTMARDAAREADVLVFVTAIPKNVSSDLAPAGRDVEILQQVDPESRAILVINKIDLLGKNRSLLLPLIEQFSKLRSFSAIVPISALRDDGVNLLLDEIASLLPERGPAYEEDFLTDRPVRFFASEYVREQVILATKQEIPHHVAVTIERFEEGVHVTHIDATVRCAREGQRKIIIGKGGERLKGIGVAARQRIESLVGRQVHLSLWVTIDQGWPESAHALDSLGYVSVSGDDEAVS
jgi:GTP-binding protein Era